MARKCTYDSSKEFEEWISNNVGEVATTNEASETIIPKAEWEFQGKKVDIIVDSHGKEWFRGRDVCKILGFRDIKDALLTKVKKVYKTDLKSIMLAGSLPATSTSYNNGKTVYISKPDAKQKN